MAKQLHKFGIWNSMIRSAIHNSFFLCILALLLLASGACRKKSPVSAPAATQVKLVPPPASVPPAIISTAPVDPKTVPLKPEPIPKIVAPPAPNHLALGEKSFQRGEYRQAIQSFESYLSVNPKAGKRDEALFYMGLSRLLAGNSPRDMRLAEVAFKRLIAEFPGNPYSNQAEYILRLQGQIERLRADVKERDDKVKQLSDELQKLKEIDMQRRPSLPQD
jgi:tetratricopeptide (TPR) repeat protein